MAKPILIDFNGKIAPLSEHCNDLYVSKQTVFSRHYRTGEPLEKCLEHFQNYGLWAKKIISVMGIVASVREQCNIWNIKYWLINTRHNRTGEPIEKCFEYYIKHGVKFHNTNYKVQNYDLYKKWCSTKQKCEDLNTQNYRYYGGRGIKVCDRWQLYENFENDLLESFLEHVKQFGLKETTLERKDYDGNYEPSNCIWATWEEQAKNRRDTKYFLPCGKTLCHHCRQNSYIYVSIVRYIKKYNLTPDKALAKYLEKHK